MITSTKNQTIKSLLKLRQKKYRDATNCYLIEGHHMVEEALKAGKIDLVITTDPDYQCDQEVLLVSDHVMNVLSSTKTPQSVMGKAIKFDDELIDGQRFLLLDNVQDPGNAGTMIRTALAFGFDQVIFSDDSVDFYNEKVLRATQGALFQLPIVRMNLIEAIDALKQKGVKVIGTSLRHAVPIDDIPAAKAMAFVMGNEGQGMSDRVLSVCDEALYIPISTMESLNVGVAAGIIMHHYGIKR